MNNPLVPVIGVITDVRVDTPDVKTFRVAAPDGSKLFEHIPGQCAMLSVPGVGEAMFSVTSSPTNEEFMEFSKKIGFKDARIRINFTTIDTAVRNQFYEKILDDEKVVEQSGLSTKYLNFDDYKVNVYLGVTDLIEYVIGVELVVDDDGKLYIDYNKRYSMNEEGLNDFDNNIFVIN